MINFDINQPASFLVLQVEEALRTVIDPELQVNIVDLGLVYGIRIDEELKQINTDMTLSSPYCPMGEIILTSVKNCIEHNFPAYKAEVKLVWEPLWNFEKITEEGKRLLG